MLPWLVSYSKFWETPHLPPVLTPLHNNGRGWRQTHWKLHKKPTCREFVRASEYTAELSLDIIDNPFSNRGSQIRRYTKQTYRPIDQDQGAERIEGGGYGTGGSHQGSITIGLSGHWGLLQMRAQVDVQDCAMQVKQGRPHLRVMLMSGQCANIATQTWQDEKQTKQVQHKE